MDFEGKCLEFCKLFLTWWSKLFSLCPEDIFEEIIFFFTKSSEILVVFRLWGKSFGFLSKIILLVCPNRFQVSMGYVWKKCYFKTNFLKCFFLFGLWAQSFWTFGEKYAIGLSKQQSMCPLELFDWTVFSTKTFECFHRLRAVRKIIWPFGAKPSKNLSKLQFIGTKNFCGKFEFWKKTFTIFSSTDQKFCDIWQKCWVIEKFWIRLFFPRKKFVSS